MHTNSAVETPGILNSGLQADALDALDEVYYFLSTDGDLLQWNDRVREVTGYTDEEIEGMSATDFFPREQRGRIVEAVSAVVAEERKVTVEADYLAKDGRRIPYEFSGTPIYDDGSVVGVIGIGRDVSERRERERLMETITENAPVVLFAFDADGVFELSQGRALEALGLSPGEVVGRSVFDVYADAPDVLETAERALDGEQFQTTVDVAGRTFDTWYRPVVTDGDVERVVGASIDVTAREEYQRRLEETNERFEILHRMVRHDIRNDLAVLLPLAEQVQTDDGDEDLQRVVDAARHIRDLTETAQEYVDIITGAEDPDAEPLAIGPVLREQVHLRRSMYENATFRVADEIPDVRVKANELLPTVFRNLLNNAVQHNDSDAPEVDVSVSVEDGTVRIDIADNGPGIPDERKERVFGKGDRSLDDPGTGIGLYLVYTLVDRYGGDVWVEDNEPRGALFRIELPAA